MNNPNYTNCQLLQEVKKGLKTNQLGFWIENQDCYLWENTFHYSNKIKIGDLSQTKEKWWADWMAQFYQYHQVSEIRRKSLEKQFQDISDVDLIEELKRRKNIKLSMKAGDKLAWIEVKDTKCGIITPFSIEIIKDEENE